MKKNKILLTGSTGFIGKVLLNNLSDKSYILVAPSRKPFNGSSSAIVVPVIDDITNLTEKCDWLDDCNVVIHIAAKAHVADVSLAEFRKVNAAATFDLAKRSAQAGIKRFIFLSSIGVHGISNTSPFSVDDSPAPVEDYAVSKFEAEIGLRKIARETGMEVVIIRPPLVYGPNAPGNFGKLVKLVNKNLPLPLGAVHNKRSLVSLDNLVDLIITCIDHPNAANQTFLVSDDHDVSTTELLREMTLAAGKKPRLFPIPTSWLQLAGKLTGKQAAIDRLCGSLQVDISHTKGVLGWKPPVSFKDGIQKCFVKE